MEISRCRKWKFQDSKFREFKIRYFAFSRFESRHLTNNLKSRGHKYKIYKKHCCTNRRKYSFSQRVVAHWNALPESVIDATSVNSFKNRLNNHWKKF
jgi:hypothetical protein